MYIIDTPSGPGQDEQRYNRRIPVLYNLCFISPLYFVVSAAASCLEINRRRIPLAEDAFLLRFDLYKFQCVQRRQTRLEHEDTHGVQRAWRRSETMPGCLCVPVKYSIRKLEMPSHTHHVPHVGSTTLAPGGPEFALMVQTPDRC